MEHVNLSRKTVNATIVLVIGAIAMVALGLATGSTAVLFGIFIPVLAFGAYVGVLLTEDLSKPHSR